MNNQEQKFIFAFSLLPIIGPARFRKIQDGFKTFEEAWSATKDQFIRKAKLDEKTVRAIVQHQKETDLEKEFVKFKNSNIRIVTEDQSDFPEQLREIKSAPFVLFCYGNVKLLRKKQLAVVGTRMYTPYGKMVVEKIVPEISRAGLVITSGMAQGVDSAAHRAALSLNNPTIAVLGGGINESLERNMTRHIIKDIITQEGLIVSEYPPDFKANKFTFPTRNRIISGLSLGSLIIEAGERSGALITARYALEQNREVFATPGNIFSQKSVGPLDLIKQGAQVVTSANDILEALNFATSKIKTSEEKIEFEDEEEKKIYEKLSLEPLHIDKIAAAAKLDSTVVSTKLSMLELRGLVRNIGGGMFIRN